MPYRIVSSDGGSRVVNAETGKVHAKNTTKTKAEAQVRLLRGVEHGMVPRSTRQAAGGGKGKSRGKK